jgi:hypothetical protein
MNYSLLEQQGLSNLVEAATALATFSSCSNAPKISAEIPQGMNGNDSWDTANQSSNEPTLPMEAHSNKKKCITSTGTSNGGHKEVFPERLMDILNDDTVCRDVISWLPEGRSFIIARPDIFMESILPRYIAPICPQKDARTVSTKYPSFTRKLNRW